MGELQYLEVLVRGKELKHRENWGSRSFAGGQREDLKEVCVDEAVLE